MEKCPKMGERERPEWAAKRCSEKPRNGPKNGEDRPKMERKHLKMERNGPKWREKEENHRRMERNAPKMVRNGTKWKEMAESGGK